MRLTGRRSYMVSWPGTARLTSLILPSISGRNRGRFVRRVHLFAGRTILKAIAGNTTCDCPPSTDGEISRSRGWERGWRTTFALIRVHTAFSQWLLYPLQYLQFLQRRDRVRTSL